MVSQWCVDGVPLVLRRCPCWCCAGVLRVWCWWFAHGPPVVCWWFDGVLIVGCWCFAGVLLACCGCANQLSLSGRCMHCSTCGCQVGGVVATQKQSVLRAGVWFGARHRLIVDWSISRWEAGWNACMYVVCTSRMVCVVAPSVMPECGRVWGMLVLLV